MPVVPGFLGYVSYKLCGALQIKSTTCEAQCFRCWEPSGIVCAQRRIHPPLGVSVKFAAKQPFSPQKGRIDRAKALTMCLLWTVVDCRGKGAKASPPLHNHRESSASLQLKLGLPPKNWFVARNSPVTLKILYSARPY
jgi:hypothetical protein